MNVKSPGPPFIPFVKNVTLPWEAVKFIVTHLFGWAGKKFMTGPPPLL